MTDLFHLSAKNAQGGLAHRLRPQSLSEILGQDHLFSDGGLLRKALNSKFLPSSIFYGPPGTGKTTAAQICGRALNCEFITLSAVSSGVRDIRQEAAAAKDRLAYHNKKTVVFIDEIHRFGKGQQDALLPLVEEGTLTLIGATTENPSFTINAALLSRCSVFEFKALSEQSLDEIIERGLQDESLRVQGKSRAVSTQGRQRLLTLGGGDARIMLGVLELAASLTRTVNISDQDLESASDTITARYDRQGDLHYRHASALIKSMRANDTDAALFWLARMLEGGEDPAFILRRIMIFAAEDIGMADPAALSRATAAAQAFERIGYPEGQLILAQAVIDMAESPKSRATTEAIRKALDAAKKHPRVMPPALKQPQAKTPILPSSLSQQRFYRAPDALTRSANIDPTSKKD